MRYVQVETDWWLVVDEVTQPKYLIHHGPAVNQRTHETHILYRVIRWRLDRGMRNTLHWCDDLAEAKAWVEERERQDAEEQRQIAVSVSIHGTSAHDVPPTTTPPASAP